MACIKKRRNRWVVDYRIGGMRKTPSFENRAEAEAFKRTLLLRPIDQVINFKEIKEVTLRQAVDQYLLQISPTKALRTQETDKLVLNLLTEKLGDRFVGQVTLMELEAYQSYLRKTYAPASVNRHFNTIRHFFGKCEDWEFIKELPTRKLSNLKSQSKQKRLWTKPEIEKFFSKCPPWLQEICYFVYETGVRRGEAVSLKWSDVDFDKNAIRIHSIKGGISRIRQIPMTVSMRDWFLTKKNTNPFLSRLDKHVFLNEEGKSLDPVYVSTNVHRIVSRLKLHGLGLHGMRHTLLTELVQSDVSLEKVRQLAGHSNLKTTEQYLHLKLDDTRSMLEDIELKRSVQRPGFGKRGS